MFKRLLMAATLTALLAACGDGEDSPPPVNPVVVAQGEINLVLDQITGKLASLETLDDAEAHFDAEFLHNSKTLTGWLADMVKTDDDEYKETFLRSTWKNAQVISLSADGRRAKVRFTVEYNNGFIPRLHTMDFVKVDGQWRAAGNQALAEVMVFAWHDLQDKPMATADVLQLPGLTPVIGDWEGTQYTYYRQSLPEAGQIEFPGATGWLGREGDAYENWGRMIWTGEEYDIPWTDYDERLLRHKYTQNISTPSSRIISRLMLNVQWGNYDPRIRLIVVRGPGLPAGGVLLTRGVGDFEFGQTGLPAYSAEICQRVPEQYRPAACELDWNALKAGAVFTFELFDEAQVKLGQAEYELPRDIIAGDELLARKGEFFTSLMTSPDGSDVTTPELSVANIFNDASGPFQPGASVTLWFTKPQTSGVYPFSYAARIEACVPGEISCTSESGAQLTQWTHGSFYGTVAAVEPFLIIPADWPKLKWIELDTLTYDSGHNMYVHKYSPKNPK